MRSVLGIVAGLITAGAVFVGLTIGGVLLGGSECDRGDCNAIGEFIADNRALTFALYIAAALVIGGLAGRLVARGHLTARTS